MSYCISVWGATHQNKIENLFVTQKKCIRVLFGDREAFLDKFRTCARVRPFGDQILGQSFYQQEHTKPIFTNQTILTVQNLYTHRCFMEVLKILKFRTPISMYSLFTTSVRRSMKLTPPFPTKYFVYNAAKLWNSLQPLLEINDFSVSISSIKTCLKKLLVDNQSAHGDMEWDKQNFFSF